MSKIRIGMGFDIHRTKRGVPLILGGYEVASEFGLVSNTDGDVVLHAIIDAMLACARLPDIGMIFPPQNTTIVGARSSELVREAMRLVKGAGFRLDQVDITILAECPPLSPHYRGIEQSISRLLEIPPENVTVKARSFEGLGEIGRCEAIAAYALVVGTSVARRQKGTPKAEAISKLAIGIEAYPEDEKRAYLLYTDGASRGNPGRSACGYILKSPEGTLVDSKVKSLGLRTNNEAEYEGVILGLERVLELRGAEVRVVVHIDSELVFNQIIGKYKIKDENLRDLHAEVARRLQALSSQGKEIKFLRIGREYNKQADELVRRLLQEE